MEGANAEEGYSKLLTFEPPLVLRSNNNSRR